ncbi:RICIN domain-containing protein [Larkinella punicea]|uniref:T9SS C-terminal target domain-containing protein n=1 Tax=Larkinella punicea TaxID=2315727 RepID=A0A368JH35_9BACT|nr:RICIN domain-containing protein [Larkinella punicea]RCR66565.1 T9SS C-terminal target domain-containing protein [Larkinella punicea]
MRTTVWFVILILLHVHTILCAQTLNVSLPLDGAVYQQVGGNGNVKVLGTFNSKTFLGGGYVVQAFFQKLDLTTGNPTSEQPRIYQAAQGNTNFSISANDLPKGWYELTVRAVRKPTFGSPKTYEQKRKVGIGEVFLIAGQSNAQGVPGRVAPNTVFMDAVRVSPNVIPEAQLGMTDPTQLPDKYNKVQNLVPTTSQPSGIGPLGNSMWYWASVGAKIAQACQAPVAFFNASYGGTTVTQWVTSTNFEARSASFDFAGQDNRYQPGSPYQFFANVLRNYASAYGVRAVLWMQGETDNLAQREGSSGQSQWSDKTLVNRAFSPINAILGNGASPNSQEKRYVRNSAEYAQKLQYVVQQSRNDLKRSVPWVIARASYIQNTTSQLIIDGQNMVLNSSGLGSLVAGPATDGITSREDGTHFGLGGLDQAADAWTNSIISLCSNPNWGQVTVQDLGTEAQSVNISADGSTVSAPGGLSYSWVRDDGTTTDMDAALCFDQTIGSNCTGRYRAVVKNADGNLVFSQAIDFPYTIVDDTNDGSTGSAPLATGCYTLKAKHSNKFLQVADGNAGTRIRQQDGNGSTNQIFKLEVVDGSLYRIISQFSNKVMDANGAGTGSGTTVNQHDWANSAQQKWRLEAYGDGTYKFAPSYSSALVADVEGPGQDNGAGLHLWSPYGGDSQRFYVQTSGCSGGTTPPPTNPPTGSLSGCYVIRSVQTNQLMEAIAGNTVEQRGANGANNQIWKAETTSANQYRFVTQNGSGLAMSVNALNNGELLRLSASSGDTRQLWTIQDNGSGAYRINGSNGVTWDMKNYGNEPQLQLWGSTSEGFQNQRLFRFESTGCPGGTPNPTTPTGGSLAFQIVSYNCTTGVLQYQFTSSNSTPVTVFLPGIFAGTMNPNIVTSYTFPNDGRIGQTATGSATQSGNQIAINFTTGCSIPTNPTTPTNPNPSGSYEGHLDGANCGNIWGWVYTPNSPNTPVTVELLANGNVVSSFVASEFRQDLQNAGKGNGAHSFNYSPPSSIKNGQNQSISVRVLGNGFVLTGSPQTINCSGGRLSTGENLVQGKITLFPNPTDGNFTVRFFAAKDQLTQLSVLDLTGRKLSERTITGEGVEHEEAVSLFGASNGIYLIQIQQDVKTITEKLILRK